MCHFSLIPRRPVSAALDAEKDAVLGNFKNLKARAKKPQQR